MAGSLLLLIVAAGLGSSEACMAAGICGASGGCGGFFPPPPVASCNPGCGPGYGCGSYGCYRLAARVHSSKTLKIPDQSDPLLMSPDEKFESCCIDRHLPDACLAKCSYTTYTKEAIRAMYFKMDNCPSQAAADIHFCAAQGRDHSRCCETNSVTTTLAGNKCLAFCDQRPNKVTQLDITYLACYHRFDQIKNCFYSDISTGEGSRLPPVSVPVDESNDEEVENSAAPAVVHGHSANRAAKIFRP